jgi:hypothetical protein
MAGVNIVDIGRQLQKYGWTVGENPAFGTGKVGKHAPKSHHSAGEAIDVTRMGPDYASAFPGGPIRSWKDLTGDLKYRAKKTGLFTEVLGPGDAGHSTHTHLALKGAANATPEMMQWVATGRYKTPEGKLTDVMPGAQSTSGTTETTKSAIDSAANTLLKAIFGAQEKQPTLTEQLLGSMLEQKLTTKKPQDFLSSYMNSGANPYEDKILNPSMLSLS